MKIVKVVIFAPENAADEVRKAIGDADGGKIGNYSHCSFSTKGIGRFIPLEGSNPSIGEIDKLSEVEEERIEFVCKRDILEKLIEEVKKVHPYEEVPVDVYPLELL